MKVEAKILQGKRAMRHHLATRPVVEKLRMLDSLRERTLSIRGRTTGSTVILRDEPTPCNTPISNRLISKPGRLACPNFLP